MLAEHSHSSFHQDLRGKRILLIEDEFYIADDVSRAFKNAGAVVVGPVATLGAAHEILDRDGFDCAILDLNLHGNDAIELADRLVAAGKSFVIATGYGNGSVPDRLRKAPRIEEPFDPAALIELIAQIHCAS